MNDKSSPSSLETLDKDSECETLLTPKYSPVSLNSGNMYANDSNPIVDPKLGSPLLPKLQSKASGGFDQRLSPLNTPRSFQKHRNTLHARDDGIDGDYFQQSRKPGPNSRRPSLVTNGIHSMSNINILSPKQHSPNRMASKSISVAPLINGKSSHTNSDTTSLGPTLVLPPELASLKTQSNSNVSLVPSNNDPFNSNTNVQSQTSTSTLQSNPSMTSSGKNNKANSTTSSSKSKRRQVWNEKLYLDKIQNHMVHDYYTRRIVASSPNEDDAEMDNDLDDMIGNNINNDDDIDFGNNFVTANTDSKYNMMMSTKYLLHRLEWLKHTDAKNDSLDNILKNINDQSESGKDDYVSSFTALSIDGQDILSKLAEHPLVLERFEWQTMLANVLKGDIVKNEKTKIASQIKPAGLFKHKNEQIWLELKAWMNGKTVEDQKRSLKALRDSTDTFFEDMLSFRLPADATHDEIANMFGPLIDRYDKITTYWCNLKQMYEEKPITKTPEFTNKIDVIVSWLNFNHNLEIHINSLREWVGNSDLDILRVKEPSNNLSSVYESGRSFAEQIMKEKNIEEIFQKKIFLPLAPWILKAKIFFSTYTEVIESMGLPSPKEQLAILLMFPMKLVEEVISVRLDYAKKLKSPTMMMIDEMIDDFISYIRLSVQIKYTVNEYCSGWNFEVEIDPHFNDDVKNAIAYLFNLLNLKLIDSQKNSFKESDELLKFWEELKNVGHYIDGAGQLIAKEINKLSLRLLQKLHVTIVQKQICPPTFNSGEETEKWLLQNLETIGTNKRKLNRFTNVLAKAFQNSVNYKIENHSLLLKQLKDSDHFLIYTGGELEQNGYYIFGSSELLGCEDVEILKILNNADIGCDLIPRLEIKNSLSLYNSDNKKSPRYSMLKPEAKYNGTTHFHTSDEAESNNLRQAQNNHSGTKNEQFQDPIDELSSLEKKLQSLGYLIILCPSEPMLWEGEMFNISDNFILKFEEFQISVVPNHLTILNQGSNYSLDYQSDKFNEIAGSCTSFVEKKCSYEHIENGLQRINKAYFRITYSLLSNFGKALHVYHGKCPGQELLNSLFFFVKDFGRSFLRVNVATYAKKSIIIMLLMKVSIIWLSFLVEKCDPSDLRTFRWSVPAMEFAMQITSGWNILGLDENQFSSLKQKIATCMSLLISHFDVMGARALEAERANQLVRQHIDIEDDVDDEEMLAINSQVRIQAIEKLESQMKHNPRQIGKVLDDTDSGNKYLLSLASSMSNVSIRWQKRQFIGSGTFGNVFSAVNLGSGEILAVKEIKIQDTQTMKKVFPLIKEEMTVLEMLNHPNIVQYYGIEVHRDKVNIFMEFCEGGSLASLLEHGRIEDEMVTQMYSLQLLEGLAYLHQSGIVHRDIKPENILLDFNGIIKYVDFGAARKIAENNTRVAVCSSNTTSSQYEKDETNTGNPNSTRMNVSGIHNMVGTPMYMAPESITGSPKKGQLGADDVWSLGCVILEMVTGKRPWASLDNEWAIMYHVAAGHIPPLPSKSELSSTGRTFLKRAIVQNPMYRSSAVDLLSDPWITEIRELAFGPTEPESSAASISTDTDS